MKNLILLLAFALQSCGEREQKIKTENNIEPEYSRDERIMQYKNTIDSINKSFDWEETTFGLWKSKDGNLALKTMEATDTEGGIMIDKYIRHLTDGQPLSEVIDTATFKYLGASFYKDKNHVYTHYEMIDGGFFQIVDEADVKTFKVIGDDCYAKDKNHIFGERKMQLDSIDYKTFRTCDDCGCFAKDKNGYYHWGEKIDINDIEENAILEIIEKLKQLK